MSHHADHIVSRIYVGSRHAVISPHSNFLEDAKIAVAISALTEDEYDDYMINSLDYPNIEWHRLVIDDYPLENIINWFDIVFEIIEDAKAKDPSGAILMHCSAGVSRSATLMAAYLIKKYSMMPSEAIQFIRRKRPCIEPNNGFIAQLEEYYHSLRA
jgi:protein-tyrosine phosphatase